MNVDNLYLKSEMKPVGANAELLRNRFVYGNVLLGLALLHQEELGKKLRKEGKAESQGEEEEEATPSRRRGPGRAVYLGSGSRLTTPH